jgi:hypothetical protein
LRNWLLGTRVKANSPLAAEIAEAEALEKTAEHTNKD